MARTRDAADGATVRLPRVGIYLPDDGYGALTRAAALVPEIHAFVSVVTPMDVPDGMLGSVLTVRLPSRRSADARATRAHAQGLLAWAEQEEPDLLLIDGCPDTVRLAQLCGIPVVVLRRVGRWSDDLESMYRGARGVLAPFPSLLEDPAAPGWVRGLTTYTEGWSRFDRGGTDDEAARAALGLDAQRPVVTVMAGMDGIPGLDASRLVEAATGVPEWTWLVVGRCHGISNVSLPENARVTGWCDDPSPHLAAGDVVVSTGGYSTIMEAASLRRPLVVVPRHRPYDTERLMAEQLAVLNAAVHLPAWPHSAAWRDVLEKASAATTAPLQALHRRDGAARAATLLHQWVPAVR